MKVTITSPNVKTKSGTSKRGSAYELREQQAYLHTRGADFPQVFSLQLEKEQQAYQPGEYTIEDGFRIGEYGRLEVSRDLRLIPSPKPQAK